MHNYQSTDYPEPEWLEPLRQLLSEDKVSTGASILNQHAKGESFDQEVLPEAVVFAESTEDVAAVMRFAYEQGIAVTPVAVNSSLEGHTVPVQGGISLDLSRMNNILRFEPENLLIVTQPAVTYPQINAHTRHSGLFFPVDPGAHASIGGMLSTNASGTLAVGYGVTADYIMALEVVTPKGEIIRTGSHARKSSSGYNLTKLFCGAEGTLGVVTEVSVRLTGLPEAASAAKVPFADAKIATEYVTSLLQAGVSLARCELVDAAGISLINQHQGTDLAEQLTIFLEFHGNPQGVAADAALARDLAESHGALAFESSNNPGENKRLWTARHNHFYALRAAHPNKRNMVTDVAVPIAHLPETLSQSLDFFAQEGFPAYIAGHVGDGNFHLDIFFDDDPVEEAKVEAASHKMVQYALSVGGTCTGEHGIGIRKLKYMQEEHGSALTVMRDIKQVFDPKGIMNPGKKLPALPSKDVHG